MKGGTDLGRVRATWREHDVLDLLRGVLRGEAEEDREAALRLEEPDRDPDRRGRLAGLSAWGGTASMQAGLSPKNTSPRGATSCRLGVP